ncbi:MAG: TonB-dependent receptor [Bacteroidales bacterium]|nr:TonB-dependent receptor [Bacteroidales bacterium]
MLAALVAIFLASQVPDTLDASVVSAARHISPPTESASRETIRRSPSLADAIRDFSGVQLRDYGGAGGLKTVNVRSLGSAHTAIFLDGVPIDNAQNLQPDLGRIEADDLEAVELYAGQKSELLQSAREYGSASSLHMKTAVPKGRKTAFRLRGGSFGTFSPSVSHEGRIGRRITARGRLGADIADGTYPFRYKDSLMRRENSDIRAFRASAGMWYTPDNGRYELSLRYYDSERGIPGPVIKKSADHPLSLDRQADRNLSVQASGEQQLSPSLRLLARARYSRDVLEYVDVSELAPSVSALWKYELQSAYLSTSLGWQAKDWLHLGAAVDAQTEKLASDVPASRRSLFTALSAAVLKDPWRVSAALQGQVTSDGYRLLSPSLILDWHPREDWEFGGIIKRSCRLPSFNDLYYTNVTARNLRPEQVWQFTARWCWDRTYENWHFRCREELYHNRVKDKLIAVPNGSLFRWSMYNLADVSVWGDEISAQASWFSGPLTAGITARYSFQWAREDGSSMQIPYIPLHSASFNIFGRWNSLRLDIRGFLTSSRVTAASSRPEYHIAPWTTWDASLGWTVSERTRLTLDVRNILNEQYEIVRQYPMPGINFLAGIVIEI